MTVSNNAPARKCFNNMSSAYFSDVFSAVIIVIIFIIIIDTITNTFNTFSKQAFIKNQKTQSNFSKRATMKITPCSFCVLSLTSHLYIFVGKYFVIFAMVKENSLNPAHQQI